MTELFSRSRDSLLESATQVAPKLAVVAGLLLVGLLLAVIARSVTKQVLGRTPIKALLSRAGADRALEATGYQGGADRFGGQVVFLLVLAFFFRSVVDTLGLTALSTAFGEVLAFLPNVLAATLVLLAGILISRVTSSVVNRAARDSDLPLITLLPRMAAAAVIVVASLMALAQLKLETALLERAATGVIWGLALGVALTFGLGSRDIARNIVSGFYVRRSYPPGSDLEIDDLRGEVSEVTPLQTFVQTKDSVVGIPNDVVLREFIRS